MDKFDIGEGFIISDEEEETGKFGNRLIKYIPLWKFLLNAY